MTKKKKIALQSPFLVPKEIKGMKNENTFYEIKFYENKKKNESLST